MDADTVIKKGYRCGPAQSYVKIEKMKCRDIANSSREWTCKEWMKNRTEQVTNISMGGRGLHLSLLGQQRFRGAADEQT